MKRIGERVKRLPTWALDSVLALAIAAADVGETQPHWSDGDAGWGVPLLIAAALPLALRRRAPVPVFFVVGLATAGLVVAGMDGTMLGVAVSTYTVAAQSTRRWSIAALMLVLVGSTVVVVIEREPHYLPEAASLFGMGWALGALQRSRAEHAAEVSRRLELLERERDERARLAVAEERARIARELHDVVAHALSVMVVQAGGALRVLPTDTDRAARSIEEIQRVGRDNLAEMRHLLGMLDPGETDADRAPQPGLGRLSDLLERFREAELPVELVVDGEPRPLPSRVDLSAYRIIQEALTNVLKHAGTVPACVRLSYRATSLEIEVVDEGAARPAGGPAANGDGRGLVGVRERVAMLGGEVSAARTAAGGFRVACSLPLERA